MAKQEASAVIIGAGLMGRWHAYYLRQLGRDILSVGDPDLDRARSLARRFHVRHFHRDVGELPGAGSVWHVCTPTPTHGALVERGLSAGAHVLVEKPLCPDAGQTSALLDTAARSGLLLCPVHQFLWQRGAMRVFRFIEALGDICHLRMSMLTAGARGKDAGAVLADLMPHPLALLARLAGPDTEADLTPVRAGPGDVLIAGTVDGMSVDVHLSSRGRPTRCDAEIVGTRCSARLNFFHGYGLFDDGVVSRRHKALQPFTQALHTQTVMTANLLMRAATREPAYPGLREIIRRFYAAVEGVGDSPSPRAESVRVGEWRDELLQRLGTGA